MSWQILLLLLSSYAFAFPMRAFSPIYFTFDKLSWISWSRCFLTTLLTPILVSILLVEHHAFSLFIHVRVIKSNTTVNKKKTNFVCRNLFLSIENANWNGVVDYTKKGDMTQISDGVGHKRKLTRMMQWRKSKTNVFFLFISSSPFIFIGEHGRSWMSKGWGARVYVCVCVVSTIKSRNRHPYTMPVSCVYVWKYWIQSIEITNCNERDRKKIIGCWEDHCSRLPEIYVFYSASAAISAHSRVNKFEL